jgi:hypothetical protein
MWLTGEELAIITLGKDPEPTEEAGGDEERPFTIGTFKSGGADEGRGGGTFPPFSSRGNIISESSPSAVFDAASIELSRPFDVIFLSRPTAIPERR